MCQTPFIMKKVSISADTNAVPLSDTTLCGIPNVANNEHSMSMTAADVDDVPFALPATW